jgi:hypothetical protein
LAANDEWGVPSESHGRCRQRIDAVLRVEGQIWWWPAMAMKILPLCLSKSQGLLGRPGGAAAARDSILFADAGDFFTLFFEIGARIQEWRSAT